MAGDQGGVRSAAILAIVAAFLWSTYFFFVLALEGAVAPSALIFYPFVVGGLGYLGWCLYQGHGRAFLELWKEPEAWARVLLLVLMQVAVLASTYLVGPVDTSLLSLVGDVVLAPLLLMLLFRQGREHARSRPFIAGLLLSVGGATLTIVGGQTIAPVNGWGLLVVLVVPFSVALYFISAARESLRRPTSAVVAQATVGAAIVSGLILPVLPGGLPALVIPDPTSVLLVVGLGLVTFLIAPLLYFESVQRGGLILASMMMATVPVFTLLIDTLFREKFPPWLALLGVPLAFAGALLAIQGPHAPWTPEYREDLERERRGEEGPPTPTEIP
jgi:drug/metabolite transporter (DMT)-like permease